MRYREALNQALREEMQRDDRVLLMGEDIGVFQGAFKVTAGLLEEFGEQRVRDTPISENTIVGMGVGAAMTGLRPVVELMTINFSLLALDQIVNHAAHIHYMFGGQARVPLVVRMPQGAGHQLGPTHSHCLEAMYLQVPGLLVAVPSTAADAKGLLKTAIRDDNPVIFIEHESLYGVRGDVPDDPDHIVDFGPGPGVRGGEVVASGTERLDKLEDDIQHGRQHLKDMTHVGEPYLYEDDERTEAQRQSDAERPPADADEAADKEAPPEGPAGDADAPPPPG